jgi:hypothetical protein
MEHVHFDTLGFVRSSGRNGSNGYNDITPVVEREEGLNTVCINSLARRRSLWHL